MLPCNREKKKLNSERFADSNTIVATTDICVAPEFTTYQQF
jgi:hypothetical protein